MDKWEWDRRSIKECREKHEPYSHFEATMMNSFNRPFSPAREIWPNRFNKDNTCGECSEGKIERKETVLSSGLKAVVLECSNRDCCFFEKFLFTPESEVLDFTHEPRKEKVATRKLSQAEMEDAYKKFKRSMRKKRKKRRNRS